MATTAAVKQPLSSCHEGSVPPHYLRVHHHGNVCCSSYAHAHSDKRGGGSDTSKGVTEAHAHCQCLRGREVAQCLATTGSYVVVDNFLNRECDHAGGGIDVIQRIRNEFSKLMLAGVGTINNNVAP